MICSHKESRSSTPQPRGRYTPTHLLIACLAITTINHWAPYVQGHHVVFEEIGELASALSYVHVVMPLNLTTLADRVKEYSQIVANSAQEINDLYREVANITDVNNLHLINGTNRYQYTSLTDDRMIKRNHRIYLNQRNITDQHAENAKAHTIKVDNFFKLFPVTIAGTGAFNDHTFHVIKRSTRETNDDLLTLVRDKRSLGLIFNVLKGVAGTFMGLYSRKKMNQLRDDLADTIKKQNRLIGVQALHTAFLAKMDTALSHIQISMFFATIADTGVTDRALSQFDRAITESITIVTNAIQAAQQHRLAIDFLTPDQLQRLYLSLIETSKQHNCDLVSENPSDLFQMELSYLFDKNDITLILHVPMVPKDNLLRLMRFHPFPIPISDNNSLIPQLDHDVLAISSGHHMTMELKYSDLMDCHQVNQIYLCERHGVLSRRLDQTCLGALYHRQHDLALQRCALEVVPQTETVLQLSDNKFLIFSPEGQTAPMSCLNQRDRDQAIEPGISQVQVPAECQLRLKYHTLFSDTSIQVETDTLAYEWKWNDHLAERLRSPDILDDLRSIAEQRMGRITLDDVIKTSETRRHRSLIFTLAIAATSIAIFGILIFLIYTYYSHRALHYVHKAIRTIYERSPDIPITPRLRNLLRVNTPTAPAAIASPV